MLDFRAQIDRERQRRDRALVRLEHNIERATDGLATKVVEGAGGLIEGAGVGMVKGVIRSSPWAACFASLGAGALLARMTVGGGSASCSQSEPQRVIVEVQHNNSNGSSAAPAPAPRLSPLDLIMQGLTVYGAVQRSFQEMQAGTPASPTAEPSQPSAQNVPSQNNV